MVFSPVDDCSVFLVETLTEETCSEWTAVLCHNMVVKVTLILHKAGKSIIKFVGFTLHRIDIRRKSELLQLISCAFCLHLREVQ